MGRDSAWPETERKAYSWVLVWVATTMSDCMFRHSKRSIHQHHPSEDRSPATLWSASTPGKLDPHQQSLVTASVAHAQQSHWDPTEYSPQGLRTHQRCPTIAQWLVVDYFLSQAGAPNKKAQQTTAQSHSVCHLSQCLMRQIECCSQGMTSARWICFLGRVRCCHHRCSDWYYSQKLKCWSQDHFCACCLEIWQFLEVPLEEWVTRYLQVDGWWHLDGCCRKCEQGGGAQIHRYHAMGRIDHQNSQNRHQGALNQNCGLNGHGRPL